MPKNPHADFSPVLKGYSGQSPFKFWCQMALPLTYDDSLSYYELLNKVVSYLNNTISDVANVEDNVGSLLTSFTQLQDYVNAYFDDLDVEQELRNILDAMALDGTLDALITPIIDDKMPGVVGTWLENNIEPTSPPVDRTLTIPNAAADAKETGDRTGVNLIRISGSISSALFVDSNYSAYVKVYPGSQYKISASNTAYWAGLKTMSFPPQAGTSPDYSEATGWTTTKSISADSTIEGTLPDDVNWLYFYAGTAGTNRLPTSIFINGIDIFAPLYDDVTYLGNMLKETNVNLGNEIKETNDKIIDIVSESGVGDYNVYHVQSQLYALANGWTRYGDNVASRGYVVFPVKPGDDVIIIGNGLNDSTYAIFTSYTTPAVGDAVPYSSATGFTANTSVNKNSSREFLVPDDGAYLYMHLGTSATNRTPANVYINNYDIMKTTRENIFRFGTPTKFRLMQYNVGKYSKGDGDNPGLPAANYDEKLTNYRKMLCKYHPDVIGIEEFIEYIDAAQTHKADDVLYNYPYPYSVWYQQYERSIKSKCPIVYSETGSISASGTAKYARYAYAKINFNGRIVSVLSTANISGTFDQDMADRAALLPEIVNKMRNDEYAFIAIDANNAGNSRGSDTIRSNEEYEIMRQTLEGLGWKTCNGEYLPLEITAINRLDENVRIALDNIFYKDNGKIVFNDFDVLSDEYANLASDHLPIYADFTLL